MDFHLDGISIEIHNHDAIGESQMATRTSMLHVRIENDLKARATETLSNLGLTVSDTVLARADEVIE